MQKLDFLLITVIAVGAMLAVIPNSSVTHVAKASTCSASTGGTSISSTTSGSCSSSSASSKVGGVLTAAGGSQSSCSSASITQHVGISGSSSSNGAISC